MRAKVIFAILFIFLLSTFDDDGYARRNKGKSADKYTKIGAEAEGNKSGDIKPYEGDEDLKCPRNVVKGSFLPNPYKGEKVLFRINYKNVNKYKDNLTPGQVARLKRNKKYYISVYPCHRNAVFPDKFYTLTEKNIKTCRLDRKNQLIGYNGGVPFPYPKKAEEVVWNIKKQYYGDDAIGIEEVRRVVSPSGRIKSSPD